MSSSSMRQQLEDNQAVYEMTAASVCIYIHEHTINQPPPRTLHVQVLLPIPGS